MLISILPVYHAYVEAKTRSISNMQKLFIIFLFLFHKNHGLYPSQKH